MLSKGHALSFARTFREDILDAHLSTQSRVVPVNVLFDGRAGEIVEDLQSALERFQGIVDGLGWE